MSTARSATRADRWARPSRWSALLAAAFVLATATTAAAEEETAKARAAQVFERAERDDAALAFDKALAEYEESLRLDPSMAKAMRAQQRAAAIRERADGGFEPLAALERVRRDPELASNPKAIDDLVRAADAFPAGLVRVEAWALAAEAYANRLGRPNDALPLWRRLAVDPRADKVMAGAAARSLASHYLARGDFAGAKDVLSLGGTNVDSKLASDVRRAVRRHELHLASTVVLAVALVAAARALVRAVREGRRTTVLTRTRASLRLALGYAAYVAIVGAVLASGYEEGTARPFLLFGVVLVPILVLARAWGAAGSPTRGARAFRAALCATSVIGAAFLVLEQVDVAYLTGLGL